MGHAAVNSSIQFHLHLQAQAICIRKLVVQRRTMGTEDSYHCVGRGRRLGRGNEGRVQDYGQKRGRYRSSGPAEGCSQHVTRWVADSLSSKRIQESWDSES